MAPPGFHSLSGRISTPPLWDPGLPSGTPPYQPFLSVCCHFSTLCHNVLNPSQCRLLSPYPHCPLHTPEVLRSQAFLVQAWWFPDLSTWTQTQHTLTHAPLARAGAWLLAPRLQGLGNRAPLKHPDVTPPSSFSPQSWEQALMYAMSDEEKAGVGVGLAVGWVLGSTRSGNQGPGP